MKAYLLDEGILLTEKDAKFESYNTVYDKKYGYYEETRERGNNFSLGQRQLISFARTIVHKPTVMVLDEATANIDTETEVLIQDSLEKIINNGTIIIVAHRLSTIRDADIILVMKDGDIVETGNHSELLRQNGVYAELWNSQFTEGAAI